MDQQPGMQIKIETSDSQIWYVAQRSAEITAQLIKHDQVNIHLNSEGPCATSLGLYDLLDNIVAITNTSKQRIKIHTCNQVEHHSEYIICRYPSDKGIDTLQDKLRKSSHQHKDIKKYFGSFVGHGNRIRLALSSYLYTHYKDKTLQSYHTDVTNPYFREFLGIEDLMFYQYSDETIKSALTLLENAPLKIDSISSYPILFNTGKVYDILDYYDNIFVDIVNQTYFTGNTFFLDDKFWRSIVTKTPFIVQGPQHFLDNLKKLGFKTFDQWWDEGYSEDPPDFQATMIIKVLDDIGGWPMEKVQQVYHDMAPILEHNYNRFLSLTADDFKKVFKYD